MEGENTGKKNNVTPRPAQPSACCVGLPRLRLIKANPHNRDSADPVPFGCQKSYRRNSNNFNDRRKCTNKVEKGTADGDCCHQRMSRGGCTSNYTFTRICSSGWLYMSAGWFNTNALPVLNTGQGLVNGTDRNCGGERDKC